MDVLEMNTNAHAVTPHVCNTVGQTRCLGAQCDNAATGLCDKAGCDFNPFRCVSG